MTPNEIKELEIQECIINHVDDYKSFRFNAGAGAGKTYALIETLKYVTVNKINVLKNSQKVACITYTNVAVNEIKKRLGNSETVHVSTIHERLWDIIKKAQPQLLICHKDKISEVIEQSTLELNNSEEANFYIKLDEQQKKEFSQYAMETKDIFYQYKNSSALLFKGAYDNYNDIEKPVFFKECLKNVANFKCVIGLLYKIHNLRDCLDRIETKKENRVIYDSRINTDRLHYMKFSHDTLLEYSVKLVKTYPTLCRLIIDAYPYFFIDEYQDTHPNVVKFVKIIHDYAVENNKKWIVGYFGDTAQCIYEDGVGKDIMQLHNGLNDINKIFNRRSHLQIINVANKIRADEIIQEPLSNDRNDGLVMFFHYNSEDNLTVARQFLSAYKRDLYKASRDGEYNTPSDNKIHCLVLTNKVMAQFNGFDDVYQVYQKSSIYHDNLNTQVLSQQLEKLHPTVLTIYKTVKLYQDLRNNKTSYYNIFGSSSNNMTFFNASVIVRELRDKSIITLRDWFELILERLDNSIAKEALGEALLNRINCDKTSVISSANFSLMFFNELNKLMNKGSEDEGIINAKIERVFDLPIKSLVKWVDFINGIEDNDIVYHTYHGTKGEEYNNVAIILEHGFGGNNKFKFKKYFEIKQMESEGRKRLFSDGKLEGEYINTQNLLYVACSRAIKNLRVLYLDDISEIKISIESIFGGCKSWASYK